MLDKFFWIIRALIYKPFFGKFEIPSYIGKPIILKGVKNIFISRKVRIFPNVRLETHGENGKIIIGENVAIAQNVHITSAAELVIGKSSTILANVFITNIDHNYKEIGKHILDQEYLIKHTSIGENCFIGMGACLQAGTTLGYQCIVGANSVVRGSFDDFSVIAGAPARVVRRYDQESKIWRKTLSDGSFK